MAIIFLLVTIVLGLICHKPLLWTDVYDNDDDNDGIIDSRDEWPLDPLHGKIPTEIGNRTN